VVPEVFESEDQEPPPHLNKFLDSWFPDYSYVPAFLIELNQELRNPLVPEIFESGGEESSPKLGQLQLRT
jgi:hypothetical protein